MQTCYVQQQKTCDMKFDRFMHDVIFAIFCLIRSWSYLPAFTWAFLCWDPRSWSQFDTRKFFSCGMGAGLFLQAYRSLLTYQDMQVYRETRCGSKDYGREM